MLQAIRSRITPSTVLATLALVFAMTGGAYAAKRYLITSTKQISPKVLKALKGANGAAGAPGAAGAGGAQGPQGAAGKAGTNGTNGANGMDGVSVTSAVEPKGTNCKEGGSKFTAASGVTFACNGEKGKEGTFGGQLLPPGKTLSGSYAAETFSEAGVPTAGFGKTWTGVSFALPLSSEPRVVYIKAGEEPPEGCSGSASEPGAEEGNLCVFAETEEDLLAANVSLRGSPAKTIGFVITGLPAAKGNVAISGTWAVTG